MSIEAMKQALKALVRVHVADNDCDFLTDSQCNQVTHAINALRTAIQQAESEPVAWSERDQLRHAQAAVVMPMIGPLLDAWENSDREVMSQEPELSKQLKNINSAMEDADTHSAPGVTADVVRDAERLNELEALVKSKGTHGLSFDYCKHVEDGYVVEKGFRVMWRHYLGERKPTLREAIDAASPAQKGGE